MCFPALPESFPALLPPAFECNRAVRDFQEKVHAEA